ncbi:hypothetical protein BSKO_04011 [Bryopsis sp. KO-2023]|nr:hypothetical protein BSKO_04011 [Bryopsis sp. KO-2023]
MDMRRFEEEALVGSRCDDTSQQVNNLVDVAFLGANLPNITAAVALASHFEGIKIKIYEASTALQGEDFIVGISPEAWKDLTAVSPLTSQSLINQHLLIDSGDDSMSDSPRSESGTVYTTHTRLMRLLASILPSGAIVFGEVPESVTETSEGMELHMKDGSVLCSKLLVTSSSAVSGSPAISTGANSGHVEVSMKLKKCEGAAMSLSQWTGKGLYATYHSIDDKSDVITFVGPQESSRIERLVDLLGQFPDLQQHVRSTTVEGIASRRLVQAPTDCSGRGRTMVMGAFLDSFPFISPQWCECMLGEAMLLKCSISEKGLTPAALRECERLKQYEQEARVASIERMVGLSRSEASWNDRNCHSPVPAPQIPLCDVTLAKGLKYAAPRDGMGWRIMS